MQMGWCVLRTSGKNTLRLAKSLADVGLFVWTPIEERMIRVPRANVRRPVVLPIMPSYVFARAEHLIDILQLIDRKKRLESDHPDFSLMRLGERIPIIDDRLLEGLRTIEQKRAPRKKAIKLPVGLQVKVGQAGGSFAGMHGRVEQSGDSYTMVCFDNRITVKISTYLLCESELHVEQRRAVRKAA
jgi:transcription antitermination factor NusG